MTMTLRALTTVALRVIALGLMFSAAGLLVTLAYAVVEIGAGGWVSPWTRQTLGGFFVTGFAAIIRVAIGLVLFVLADKVARLVCRGLPDEAASTTLVTVGAGDAYHIVTFAMGVLFVARSLGPLARAMVEMISAGAPTASVNAAASFLEAVMYLALGLGLMLGSRGIARFFATLGHDPDNVPAQQISLRVILVFVVGCALLLALARLLVG